MSLLPRVLVVALLCVFVGVSTAAPASAVSGREKKMFHRINKARANHGKPPLKLSAQISKMARKHSKKMAANSYIFHSCLQCKFQSWNWHALAENVAKGKTIGKVQKAFMKSSGHRANILSTKYKKVGVGIVEAKGWLWVTEIFYG
jgi:uncharacterized protein YkwD